MSRIIKMLLGAGTLVIALSMLMGSVALAADATPQSSPTPAATTPAAPAPATTPEATPTVPPAVQTFISRLAANLGVSEAKLRSALVTTEKQAVDDAVQQGKLTKDQAASIKQKIDQSNGLPFGLMHGERGYGHGRMGGADLSGIATFLGITPQALKTELQSGKSLAAIAAEHGKTRDQLKQYLISQRKARLDAAVKSNRITAAQEKQMLDNYSKRVDALIDRTGGPSHEQHEETEQPSENASGTPTPAK
jgi:transposase-like protein